MIKLPIGVDINNLIDDLKNFSWEAADILMTYTDIIKNSENKDNCSINSENNNMAYVYYLSFSLFELTSAASK